jgi:hypothetical protein
LPRLDITAADVEALAASGTTRLVVSVSSADPDEQRRDLGVRVAAGDRTGLTRTSSAEISVFAQRPAIAPG